MRVEIRGKKSEIPEQIKEYARYRLRFAFGRFADYVSKIVVRLADQNGPRGEQDDKRCVISVRSRDTEFLIDESADTYEAALARGAQRAGATLRRHLDWQKDWRRGRMAASSR